MISLLPQKEFRINNIFFAGGYSGIVLLLRSVLTLFFSRQRDLSQYATVDSSAMVFILYSIIAFFVSFNDLIKDKNRIGSSILFHTPIMIFFLYTIYGAITMLWSVNLQLTGFRAFECLAMLMLIVATIQNLFQNRCNELVLEWSVFFVSFCAVLSVISALSWTRNIFDLLMRSQMDATCFFFMALYAPKKNWRHLLIMAMSLFSMSTTAYIGMALGLLSMYKVQASKRIKLLIYIVSFIILITAIIIGPQQLIKDTIFFDKEAISLENTSGRNHIMDVAIESSLENPFGLGFFSAEPYVLYYHGLSAINGHNSFFSAAMGTGIVGVLLMLVFFIGVARNLIRKKMPRVVAGPLFGCFCVAFLHCMGNPGLGSRVYGGWLPTLYVFTLICAYDKFGDIENRIM